jgi:hypothetical protein
MKLSDLKPAGTLAQKFGVKCLGYGPPGSGKTPIINTAPNPLMLVTEPGLLSMRGSTVPAFEAFDVKAIDEFFKWLFGSTEPKKFDTICVDSTSQMAEINLLEAEGKSKDGRAVYGIMSKAVMKHINKLFFMENKHIFLIAKEGTIEETVWNFTGPIPQKMTVMKKVPYFPGRELGVKIPHLYDEVLYMAQGVVPGQVGEMKYIRTNGSSDVSARDRSGKLDNYEPQDLNYIFNKINL